MNRRRSGRSDEEQARWARAVLGAGARQPGSECPGSAGGACRDTWRETWDGLELPPAPAVPPGFAHRVARAAEVERERASAPVLGAGWMRAAAAAALLAGIALGSTLALQSSLDFGNGSSAANLADELLADEDSWTATLSEEYLLALATGEASPAAPAADAPGSREAGQ